MGFKQQTFGMSWDLKSIQPTKNVDLMGFKGTHTRDLVNQNGDISGIFKGM